MLQILGLAVVCYAVYWLSTSQHEKAVAVREWIKDKFNRA